MAVTCDMDTLLSLSGGDHRSALPQLPARRAVRRPTEWVEGSLPRLGRLASADSFLPPVGRDRAAGCICLPDQREASGWDVRTDVRTS